MIRGDLECHASLSLFFHFRSLILSFSFSVVAHCFISPFLFQASASLIFSLFYVFFFFGGSSSVSITWSISSQGNTVATTSNV